jgi:hypothetical protein
LMYWCHMRFNSLVKSRLLCKFYDCYNDITSANKTYLSIECWQKCIKTILDHSFHAVFCYILLRLPGTTSRIHGSCNQSASVVYFPRLWYFLGSCFPWTQFCVRRMYDIVHWSISSLCHFLFPTCYLVWISDVNRDYGKDILSHTRTICCHSFHGVRHDLFIRK